MGTRASSAGRAALLDEMSTTLLAAPFQPDAWMGALGLLAEATGSSHGELIGWNGPYSVPFNLISDLPDDAAELVAAWERDGGADPLQNPIVRRGTLTRNLEVVSDDEIISRDDRKSHRIWAEFYDKLDMPHICFTPLWRDGHAQLMLTVLRSSRDGVIDADQRRLFAASAPAWQAAATLARALRNEAGRLLAGAFDTLSIAAVVVDGFGRPMSVSSAAQSAFDGGRYLRVTRGVLCDAAGRPINLAPVLQPPQRAHAIRLTGEGGGSLVLRASPLPRAALDLGFGAAALVVLEPEGGAAPIELPLHIAARLTPAERTIANHLLAGERPAQIADRRGIAVETVRTHIKRIYAKCDVAGVVEFLAKARS